MEGAGAHPRESSLELGTGQAIDIQGPKWSPVPPGTKGRGKKRSELCLASHCAGPAEGPPLGGRGPAAAHSARLA